jgi:WD40 repeat protein
MHVRRRSNGVSCASDNDPRAEKQDRGFPVRLSILSRELLLTILLVGAASYLVGLAQDGLWNHQTSNKSLPGHDMLLERVVYAADGRTLISCGWDKQVKFWNVATDAPEWGREIDNLAHNWAVFSFTLTADGKYLASAGSDGFSIWTRQSENGSWELNNEHRGSPYRCLAVSPDRHTLAVGDFTGAIRFWDLEARKELLVLDRFGDQLRTIEFSPSGAFLAACAFSGEFRIWDLRTPSQPRPMTGGPESVQSFTFSPDDRTVAVAQLGPGASALGLWDLRTCSPRLSFSDNMPGNNSLAFSSDGRLMASADKDRTIRFWDTTTGELKRTLKDGVGWVKTLAFSPDGRRIAFGGTNGRIQFRNLNPEGSQQPQTRSS